MPSDWTGCRSERSPRAHGIPRGTRASRLPVHTDAALDSSRRTRAARRRRAPRSSRRSARRAIGGRQPWPTVRRTRVYPRESNPPDRDREALQLLREQAGGVVPRVGECRDLQGPVKLQLLDLRLVAQPIEDRGQLAISDLLQRRGRFCQRRLDPIWHNADPLAIPLGTMNISPVGL